jgi:uncharacterized protein (TIGR04255 family)
MHFPELIFEKAVLEVRYPTNYLFWDNSGKTILKFIEKYPHFELRDAQLSNVQYDWWSEGMILNFNHQKADVTQDYPKTLDNFKNVSAALCDALKGGLEVKMYERIGCRYIFLLPMKTSEEARDLFLKLNLVSLKSEKLQHFLKGKIEEEQAVVRYEDDDRGYTFRFLHSQRELKLRVSRPVVVNTDNFHKNGVIFDVDCYTKKSVGASVFMPADFIRLTFRTVEENLLPLLGL